MPPRPKTLAQNVMLDKFFVMTRHFEWFGPMWLLMIDSYVSLLVTWDLFYSLGQLNRQNNYFKTKDFIKTSKGGNKLKGLVLDPVIL